MEVDPLVIASAFLFVVSLLRGISSMVPLHAKESSIPTSELASFGRNHCAQDLKVAPSMI